LHNGKVEGMSADELQEFICMRIQELQGSMNRAEFHRHTGVHQNLLASYEKRESWITLVNLLKICDKFGMTLSEFFAGAAPRDYQKQAPIPHHHLGALIAAGGPTKAKAVGVVKALYEEHEGRKSLNRKTKSSRRSKNNPISAVK
jgi:transcriptional regulator with XRE-family HTH domain